jgi:dUTP pyrophosphatase
MKLIKIQYSKETTPRMAIIPHGDWIDISTPVDIYLTKDGDKLIDLEIAMQLPKGYEAHIIPRSSSFKKYGFLLVNSVGMIDESYSGSDDTWKAHLLGTRIQHIPTGTRILQFRIVKKQPDIKFECVEKLLNPNRGGIGSTGD